MFENLIESTDAGSGRSKTTMLVSFGVHAIVLLTMIVIPLYYYDALPDQELLTFLAAPPPPRRIIRFASRSVSSSAASSDAHWSSKCLFRAILMDPVCGPPDTALTLAAFCANSCANEIAGTRRAASSSSRQRSA